MTFTPHAQPSLKTLVHTCSMHWNSERILCFDTHLILRQFGTDLFKDLNVEYQGFHRGSHAKLFARKRPCCLPPWLVQSNRDQQIGPKMDFPESGALFWTRQEGCWEPGKIVLNNCLEDGRHWQAQIWVTEKRVLCLPPERAQMPTPSSPQPLVIVLQ